MVVVALNVFRTYEVRTHVFCCASVWQDATSLAFPPDLDNTSRKFIHEAVKRLGLDSKSRGKGEHVCCLLDFD